MDYSNKKIKFVRFGNLNSYRNSRNQGWKSSDIFSFHAAPERNGIYCFPFGYMEMDLVPFGESGIGCDAVLENISDEAVYKKIRSKLNKKYLKDKEYRKQCTEWIKEYLLKWESEEYKDISDKQYYLEKMGMKKHCKSYSNILPFHKPKTFFINSESEIYTHLGVYPNIRIIKTIGSWNLIKAKDLNYFLLRRGGYNNTKNFIYNKEFKCVMGYDKDNCEIFIPKRTKIY